MTTPMSELTEVVRDLASPRADSLSDKQRKELMDIALQSLQMSTMERKVLANRKGMYVVI